ncbi:MAG: hypothetical protein LWX02_08145 [Deltaproteobacteria bacterium]|nr:hypothetical protein [Deltaproteobacteria bacterium]MDL1987482.1 hypothetical protein [Deltaproteobacteria bacterium]
MSREKVAQYIVVQGYPARVRLVRDAGGGARSLQRWHSIILAHLFPHATGFVTVIPIVSHHLFAPIGDV